MASLRGSRTATHAGSWYSGDGERLSVELDRWLDEVPSTIEGEKLPPAHARVIIAPHAGYSYSGPTAAWAYRSLNLTGVKRIFLLGPSHHAYLTNCAVTSFSKYSTPLGPLTVDQEITAALLATGEFSKMDSSTDEDEHSLELHLPYIHKMISRASSSATLVPILVGSTKTSVEKSFGSILAPYLLDPSNAFVVSSDFCHWGSRFSYTYYLPDLQLSNATELSRSTRPRSQDAKVHESIAFVDELCMDRIKHGIHDEFLSIIKETGNTVCGRHPIGILMAAMESLKEQGKITNKSDFTFVRYTRSSDCMDGRDSSVSYASAYAVIDLAEGEA